MSLTLWTDSYATVEDIDKLLITNKDWQTLTTATKEDYIKSAAFAIDTHFEPAGTKVNESQTLNFPRDFGGASDNLFDQNAQARNLKRATYWQCVQYLKDACFGIADFTKESDRKFPSSLLSDNAYIVLKIYKFEGVLV